MKAEASAALIAACGEEWIERPASDIGAHAAAIVGEKNFNIVTLARGPDDKKIH
jgi:hypothetical protein